MFNLRMASIVCTNRPLNYIPAFRHTYVPSGKNRSWQQALERVVGINKSARGNKRSDATAVETTRRAKTKEAQAVWQRKGMRATLTS